MDGEGVNGIAPKVGLVALKISQWCGAAFDSEIIAAFLYAADHGIDVVNISFGGYLDRTDPDQDLAVAGSSPGWSHLPTDFPGSRSRLTMVFS